MAYLAIQTIEKAIKSQESIDLKKLMIHSDQESQYTSKEFIDYCASKGILKVWVKLGVLTIMLLLKDILVP